MSPSFFNLSEVFILCVIDFCLKGGIMDTAEIKELEKYEEKTKHVISPCDEESGDYSVIKLNRKDAENLRELLTFVLKQLEK